MTACFRKRFRDKKCKKQQGPEYHNDWVCNPSIVIDLGLRGSIDAKESVLLLKSSAIGLYIVFDPDVVMLNALVLLPFALESAVRLYNMQVLNSAVTSLMFRLQV